MEQQVSVVTAPARISLEDFIETVTRSVLRALEAREVLPTTGGVQAASTAQSEAYLEGGRIVIGIIYEPRAVVE